MRDGQEEPVNQTKGSAGNEVFGYMYTVVQAQLELCSYESDVYDYGVSEGAGRYLL